jgi:hypothetical protein
MAYKVVGADEDGHFPPRVEAALSATFVPKWKATTAYLAGDKVLSPGGDVVSAKVNFTSGASYNAANWDLSATYAPVASPTFTGTVTGVSKGMVGLGSVDNTADSAKPISTAQAAGLAPLGVASPRQSGDSKNGALDWRHEGTDGYLTHFVMGASSLALAGCYAAGTDLGLGDGFFVSHKNSGAGIRGIGQGGSSILQYMVGYSHSTLYNGEIFKGNQGMKLFAKIGEGYGDGVATNGSTTFTSATAAFTGADVGQTIQQTTTKGTLNVTGTIPSGATIASVTNATTVVLSAAATASGTGINFLIGGRAPATTQSMFTLYDTNGTTKRYEFTLGKYTGVVPHEIQSNDVAAQSLLVKAASGQTAEILTVLKDGNATGALSVTASGLIAARFGSSLTNAGLTANNAVSITNSGTAAHSLYITRASAQTGDQISLRDNAGVLQSRFNKDSIFMTKVTTAPADADLVSGEVAIYFDSTNGAAKLKIKAKQADGTVRTGEVALA